MTCRSVFFIAFALLAFSLGCGSGKPADPYGPDATAEDFAELRLSLTVNDPRVKDELERLQNKQELPVQLAEAYRARTEPTSGEQIVKFLRGRDPDYVDAALTETAHWWDIKSPGRELLIDAQGQDFLKKWNVQRTAARAVLLQPRARFPIEMEQGTFADPTWIGTMHCLARAELLEAASQASQNNMSEAVTAAAYALAYADQLNQAPSLAARNAAVAIREETFVTLRALMRHPQFSGDSQRTLETVLQQTVQAWPSDAELWKADRAFGLHFLEVIRSGNFASVLTREEYDAMMASGEFGMLQSKIMRSLTMDQAFYLDAMRDVVESSEKPYHERAAGLFAISDALNQAESSGSFPTISGEFLLSEIHARSAEFSKDKTRTVIWLTALQTANGHPPAVMPISDFSGKPIVIQEEPGRVIASFEGLPGEIPNLEVRKLPLNEM